MNTCYIKILCLFNDLVTTPGYKLLGQLNNKSNLFQSKSNKCMGFTIIYNFFFLWSPSGTVKLLKLIFISGSKLNILIIY